MSEANIANRRYQCRHIFTDGRRCGSPCLRGENFCYYHHATRVPKPVPEFHDPYNYPPNKCQLTLTLPEDRSAIQHSIGQIMKSLAENALDPRRAGLLLYALQIASMNLKNARPPQADEVVQDVTLDPIAGPLAPHNEVPGDELYREFLQSLDDADDEDEDEDEDFDDDDDDDQDEEEDEDEDEDYPEVQDRAEICENTALDLQASAEETASVANPASTPLSPATDVLYEKVPRGGYPPHPLGRPATGKPLRNDPPANITAAVQPAAATTPPRSRPQTPPEPPTAPAPAAP